MIIGVSGYAKSGKDTVAQIICSQHGEWKIKKFAHKLKEIASLLTGFPVEFFEDQSLKDIKMNGWEMTSREFMQKLGTEAIRNNLHEDAWVNALMSEYAMDISFKAKCVDCRHSWGREVDNMYRFSTCPKCASISLTHDVGTKWVITDCRFSNEANAIKRVGGVLVRINRPNNRPTNNHPSEVSLDDYEFDYILNNNTDIEGLERKVSYMLRKLELIS